MFIKETIKRLEAEVKRAQVELENVLFSLSQVKQNIQNHVYESIEEAENFLSNMFENMAFEDCEGADNYGADEYTQDFIVEGKEYTATMTFEYNRHDKRFYYIDGSNYNYKEKNGNNP